jgi:hypothetical protein
MEVALWFYRGDGKIFDKLNRWWTKGEYSHVEIVVDGTAYGADAWSGRVIQRHVSGFNPQKWDIVPVSSEKDLQWLEKQVGKKYDYLGILGFFFFAAQRTSWWYCSELAAVFTGIKERPISPQRLYEILTEDKDNG